MYPVCGGARRSQALTDCRRGKAAARLDSVCRRSKRPPLPSALFCCCVKLLIPTFNSDRRPQCLLLCCGLGSCVLKVVFLGLPCLAGVFVAGSDAKLKLWYMDQNLPNEAYTSF